MAGVENHDTIYWPLEDTEEIKNKVDDLFNTENNAEIEFDLNWINSGDETAAGKGALTDFLKRIVSNEKVWKMKILCFYEDCDFSGRYLRTVFSGIGMMVGFLSRTKYLTLKDALISKDDLKVIQSIMNRTNFPNLEEVYLLFNRNKGTWLESEASQDLCRLLPCFAPIKVRMATESFLGTLYLSRSEFELVYPLYYQLGKLEHLFRNNSIIFEAFFFGLHQIPSNMYKMYRLLYRIHDLDYGVYNAGRRFAGNGFERNEWLNYLFQDLKGIFEAAHNVNEA